MAKKNKLKKALKKLKNQQRLYAGSMANGRNSGFMRGLNNLLPSGKNERFLLGLLIGAGTAYVLSDENLRGGIIKSAMKLYAGFAGEFEEIKEQIADYQAELEAGQHNEA